MSCPERTCTANTADKRNISLPETHGRNTPWKFYNHLIGKMPDDIYVRDYCLGTHWTYMEADCGMGVSFTCKGGGKRTHKFDLRGRRLKEVAELAKSWNFEEASLGVAALNAWYARPELLDPLGAAYDEPIELPDGSIRKIDAFEMYRPRISAHENACVTVVGHFPNVNRISEYAQLTVLERNCTSALDTPDPACEYVVPASDYTFITGVTIINKTAPRLLELAKNGTTVFVGPSVVISPFLFDWDVETLAGSVVADPEKVRFAVKSGSGQLFGEALQMCTVTRPKE
ncbi:Rossmann-like domain-containing protein [Slackia piriformis]|uniref:Rossmann-like domain-containing protein n=1 Tax=Slackia piriformis TaxID=626934 RepID=UPI0032C1DE19